MQRDFPGETKITIQLSCYYMEMRNCSLNHHNKEKIQKQNNFFLFYFKAVK